MAYDLFAREYGYTIDQFLDLTPLQFQKIHKKLLMRKHNERAFMLAVNRHDIKGTAADFKDYEHEKMIDEMLRNSQK